MEQRKLKKLLSELILGKHRNGSTGTIELLFERDMSNFRNHIFKQKKSRNTNTLYSGTNNHIIRGTTRIEENLPLSYLTRTNVLTYLSSESRLPSVPAIPSLLKSLSVDDVFFLSGSMNMSLVHCLSLWNK